MSYNLFLDDVRKPTYLGDLKHYEVARNYNEFVQIIKEKGLPNFISFDHDLGFEHYPLGEQNPTLVIPYDTYKEKTGYHAAQWLISHCIDNNLPLPKWQCHSMNVVGRANIKQLLTRFQQKQQLEKEKNDLPKL
jgi:hypothetical protein